VDVNAGRVPPGELGPWREAGGARGGTRAAAPGRGRQPPRSRPARRPPAQGGGRPARSRTAPGGSSQTAPDRRLLDRRREVARGRVRRRRRVLLLTLATLVLAALLWRLSSSSLFGLSGVDVEGADHLTERQVVAAAEVRVGEPVLRLDLDAIRVRVERLPWVAHAAVARVAPSGLRIEVTERTPAASVAVGGRRWLVAADGVVLAASPARPPGVPFVSGVHAQRLAPGTRVAGRGALANALAALRGMSPALRREVSGIRAASVEGLAFSLRGGGTLVYGAAERLAAKDEAALLLLRHARAGRKEVVKIDVRAPSTPVMQAKNASTVVENDKRRR
jgi:cell division protein FtsQ